ncbi:MAG: transglycosylase SLT domain-containing protein [Anaerolineae bacterium]|nr:transglycosylase SLT domain-containing protein [Anaerolineae bacterium]
MPASRRSALPGRLLSLALRLAATAAVLAGALVLAPSAAADPSQEVALSSALALKHDGRYEEAAGALQALLPHLQGPDRLQTLAQLAECHELREAWSQAAEVWHSLALSTYDRGPRSVALFRQAVALQAAGDHSQAAPLFVAFFYLRPGSPAEAEALSRAADSFAASGEWGVAAHYYRMAHDRLAAGPARLEVTLKLAEALILSEQQSVALELLRAEAATVPEEDLARYQYRWAQAERAAGQEQAGIERLRALIQHHPRSRWAHPALIELLNAGQEVDEYLRGLVNYYAKAYQQAAAAFERYLASAPPDNAGSAHYLAGLSYRSLGDTVAALAHFDAALASPESPDAPRAQFARAETLARAGDLENAVLAYRSLADSYPTHELAPKALLAAGSLLEQVGSTDRALEEYARLYQTYGDINEGREGALLAGLIRFRQGDWEGARSYFQTAADLCAGCDDRSRYAFWLARTLLAQGDAGGAAGPLQEAAASDGYYSYRARVLLSGQDPLRQPGAGNLLLPEADAGRAEAEAWLQARYDAAWHPGELPASVRDDPRFRTAQEFLQLGLRSRVVELALSLSRDLARDGIAQYSLALWLRDNGLYRPSIQCAANIIYTTPNAETEVPRFIWSLVYPTYYSDLVIQEGAANGIDPLLFFALMRQESLFDAVIGSSAGAQGLAQVMPATGDWIAGQLGDQSYSAALLLRPHVSIRYGVWYLKTQLDYLGGDTCAALAAYNAGPGNAAKWAARAGSDPDLFYETVAFSETRKYLATVLPNYLQYIRLYRE